MSPLVAAALLIVRARSGGLPAGAAGRATSSPSVLVGWLHGSSVVLSQFFAWVYLLIVMMMVSGVLNFVVGEIKLRREYDVRRRRRALPDRHRLFSGGSRNPDRAAFTAAASSTRRASE